MTELPAQHTGLPWEVKRLGRHVYVEAVSGKPDGGFICDTQADEAFNPEERKRIEANAALIVRAVNSHDGLLAACRDAVNTLRAGSSNNPIPDTALEPWASSLCRQLDRAIARAEGANDAPA